MSARTEIECDWCGRNDVVGSITDDLGDTYHWCTRHEEHVRSMIEDTLLDDTPERDHDWERKRDIEDHIMRGEA